MKPKYRYGAAVDCNTRYKIYGDDVRVAVFSRDIFKTEAPTIKREKERGKATGDRREDNIARAKNKVFDIAYSNDWKYFVTLTLDPKKIDRVDYEAIRKAYRIWISNLVQRQNIRYLTVAEYHKKLIMTGTGPKRAIHFHTLLSNMSEKYLKDSGRTDSNGHKIFNLTNWGYGWTTAIATYGTRETIAKYLTKYLTKDFIGVYGKQYWSGGPGLVREVPTVYGREDYTNADGTEYTIKPAYAGATVLGVKYRNEFKGDE